MVRIYNKGTKDSIPKIPFMEEWDNILEITHGSRDSYCDKIFNVEKEINP
jgi:hypothetical protein